MEKYFLYFVKLDVYFVLSGSFGVFLDLDSSSKEVMFRRRLTFSQLAFATVLGVAGGVYIYKPYFIQPVKNLQQNQDASKKREGTD